MLSRRPADRTGRRQSGTILLFALMIMASIVITATGLTAVILSSLQQSRAIDNSIIAYYAAESGVEEAVFDTRKNGALPTEETTKQALSNGAAWTRAVQPSEPVVYAGTVPQDSLVEIALYNPDQPTTATSISQVTINWTDNCSGCSVVDMSLVSWKAGGDIVWDPNAAIYSFTGGSATLPADAGKLYRLRLIARRAQIENLQIRVYDAGGAALDIPGRVRVDAVGYFGGVQQRLTATMPRQTPLSGIYDYVIFSECSLVKNSVATCP